MKAFVMTIAFLLEIAMLLALGYWGFCNHHGVLMKCLFGIGSPAAVGVLWGVFLAPKSNRRLPTVYRIVISLAFFLLSDVLLYQTGQTTYAIVLAITALAVQAYVFISER